MALQYLITLELNVTTFDVRLVPANNNKNNNSNNIYDSSNNIGSNSNNVKIIYTIITLDPDVKSFNFPLEAVFRFNIIAFEKW